MDQYFSQLQAEIAQSNAYNQIKAQYDVADKQRQTTNAGNAALNMGMLIASVPKASSAISALASAIKVPMQIKSGFNDMIATGMKPSELSGASDRIMGLVKDLRANPELKVSFQNYTTQAESKVDGALGNFNLDYNRITGKSVEFQNPNELSVANKMDQNVSTYENFIRNNRGLSQSDAEAESDKFVARLGDMMKSRANVLERNPEIAEQENLSSVDDFIANARGVGGMIRSGFSELAPKFSEFGSKVGDYARQIYNNFRGYNQMGEGEADVNMNDINNILSDTDLRDFMLTRTPANVNQPDEIEMQTQSETANLLDSEEQLTSVVRTPATEAVSRINPEPASSGATSSTASNPEPVDITTGESATEISPSSADVPTAISAEGKVAELPTTAPEVAPSTATTAPEISASTGIPVAETPVSAAGTAAEAISTTATTATEAASTAATTATEAATTAATTATTAASEAGAAASGVLSGVGEAISAVAGPIGALLALGGAIYSIFSAVHSDTPAPAEQPTTEASFNPIKTELPATTMHF